MTGWRLGWLVVPEWRYWKRPKKLAQICIISATKRVSTRCRFVRFLPGCVGWVRSAGSSNNECCDLFYLRVCRRICIACGGPAHALFYVYVDGADITHGKHGLLCLHCLKKERWALNQSDFGIKDAHKYVALCVHLCGPRLGKKLGEELLVFRV